MLFGEEQTNKEINELGMYEFLIFISSITILTIFFLFMKYSSFNIDLVGGVIPSKTHKGQPVKTNTFYRDAFIHEIQGCPNLPSDLKRQMGLTQIFSDDSQKNNPFVGNKGMTKKRSLGSILPPCSLNFNR